MRCRECDYPLWNLRSRDCPECGRAFLPSEYEFVTDSVRFCCPECGQNYYGTGEKGHLVPESFNCVKCGHPCRMDEMVLLPTEGVDEESTRVEVVPWLERGKIGVVRAWLGTIGRVLGSPSRLGSVLPAEGGALQAAWFAILTGVIYFAIGYAVLIVPIAIMGMSLGAARLSAIAGLLAVVISMPIGLLVYLTLWSAAAHIILRMSGAVAGGFSRTFVCLCYGSAANILMAIPCVGGHFSVISWVWWAIASGILLMQVHRVSGLRAQAATFIPPLALGATVVTLMFVLIIPGMTASFQKAAGMRASPGSAMVVTADFAVRRYMLEHNNAEPEHALRLLASGRLGLADLYEPGSLARARIDAIGGVVVADVPGLPRARTETVIADAASSLDATGAHRLGDLVFLYRGLNTAGGGVPDPELWRVVFAPLSPTNPSIPLVVATESGTISIPRSSWATSLAKQNALRVSEGLPPIPDPLTIGLAPPPGVTPPPK